MLKRLLKTTVVALCSLLGVGCQVYHNEEGVGAAIGMSNFYPNHLIDLASNVEIPPMVNQVETHVFDQQTEAQKYMEDLTKP